MTGLAVMSAFVMASALHCADQGDVGTGLFLMGLGWLLISIALVWGEDEEKQKDKRK